MSQPAIIVEDLSKRYQIGTSGGPAYHRLSEMLTGLPRYAYNQLRSARPELREPTALASGSSQPTGNGQPPTAPQSPDFWALRDVSFEVQPGEVVGIIGRNGAGKSTLLKILSRITEPTSGRFGVRGRVASLLEVGTGFHPELTGRENIYVSGVTLGMTRAEIKKRFDEIVDFSGVENFLDTPVKRYSSGMQVRLGFAVAAHLESEILIVDEVLAVGDAEFQKKCLGKMNDVARGGRTVLFVSHNMAAVRSLCSRCLLLAAGRVDSSGSAGTVCDDYLAGVSGNRAESIDQIRDRQGSGVVRFIRAEIRGSRGAPTATSVASREPFHFVLELKSHRANALVSVAIGICDLQGSLLCSLNSKFSGVWFRVPRGRSQIELSTLGLPLIAGRYSVELRCLEKGSAADVLSHAMELSICNDQIYSGCQQPTAGKHGPVVVDHSWAAENGASVEVLDTAPDTP